MGRVSRFEVDLALAGQMIDAAVQAAHAQAVVVSVAVVDAGGHLIAFARMDGAEIAGPRLATDKAFTAVAHRSPTADLQSLVAPGGPLAGMYAADAGRYVCFPGGVPLWDGERVIAGIGVSGGTADEDATCALAAQAIYTAAVDQPA